jgi:hypothetical protein
MFVTKLGLLLITLLILICNDDFVESCDIVGASACPHRPEKDLKQDDFDEYCEMYKLNLECVYESNNKS